VFESASTLNPRNRLSSRFHASRRDGYNPDKHPENNFSHEVCTYDLYFPTGRARVRKSIVSRTECIFDLPRFTRKIIPRPSKRKREYGRVPFVLTCGTHWYAKTRFRWATNERISAWRLESDVYLFACWLVGGVDLFGCWMGMYQIIYLSLLLDAGNSRYIRLFPDKITSYTSFFLTSNIIFFCS